MTRLAAPAFAVALALVLALLPVAEAAPPGFVLRDDVQREVTLPRDPQRIITLVPSLTEIVCALGACDRLVATDEFSNWPAQAKALPKAGGFEDPQIEQMVSLKPDLVLLSRSQRITERLSEFGVVSFALNTENYSDIAHTVRTVGLILGLAERAAHLDAAIEQAVREIGDEARARRRGDGPTVYVEVDRGPYAAGPASFIGEILIRLGARNIVTADLGPFPRLNPEYVVNHDPEVIFIAAAEAAGLAERPGWKNIRAVKEHRFCSFPAEVRDTIVRPGPRVAQGMRAMADCLARVAP
ncbi:MAG TPA: helical backbone metal receptor [Steroidobacteraceae bacterium]|nr:helical backbone metal receptor [Steroidobacteraceae bacterium]